MSNKKQDKMGRYRERALDSNEVPMRRLRAAKSLAELAGYSQRTCPVARRVANELLNPEMPDDVRGAAIKLLESVAVGEAQRLANIRQQPIAPVVSVDDEVERIVNGQGAPLPVGIKPQAPVESEVPALPKTPESRQEELARKNAHWNDSPVPQKWLHFYEPSDLASFGIANPVTSDPRRLFIDVHDLNKNGELFGKPSPAFPNKMCNPLYIDAYRKWKQERFPHGLPDRVSTWRIRWETRSFVNACPELLRMWPAEFPVGEELRHREHLSGDVSSWEEPFCHELYFEILLGHRREFFVMFETDDTTEAYFRAREHDRKTQPKSAVTEERPLPQTKMVCRVCHNASAAIPAPVHDCSQFMEPEIFARMGARTGAF